MPLFPGSGILFIVIIQGEQGIPLPSRTAGTPAPLGKEHQHEKDGKSDAHQNGHGQYIHDESGKESNRSLSRDHENLIVRWNGLQRKAIGRSIYRFKKNQTAAVGAAFRVIQVTSGGENRRIGMSRTPSPLETYNPVPDSSKRPLT